MKRFGLTTLLAIAVSTWVPAQADQLSAALNVSLKLIGACTSITATPLDFGEVARGGGSKYVASSAITINCFDEVDFVLSFGSGLNPINDLSKAMRLQGGTDTLAYQLYQDAGMSQIIGSQTRIRGRNLRGPLTIHALPIGSNKNKALGTYTDVVTLTLDF